jgi:hypothetical protein
MPSGMNKSKWRVLADEGGGPILEAFFFDMAGSHLGCNYEYLSGNSASLLLLYSYWYIIK